jgi:hypothetical protein
MTLLAAWALNGNKGRFGALKFRHVIYPLDQAGAQDSKSCAKLNGNPAHAGITFAEKLAD